MKKKDWYSESNVEQIKIETIEKGIIIDAKTDNLSKWRDGQIVVYEDLKFQDNKPLNTQEFEESTKLRSSQQLDSQTNIQTLK